MACCGRREYNGQRNEMRTTAWRGSYVGKREWHHWNIYRYHDNLSTVDMRDTPNIALYKFPNIDNPIYATYLKLKQRHVFFKLCYYHFTWIEFTFIHKLNCLYLLAFYFALKTSFFFFKKLYKI